MNAPAQRVFGLGGAGSRIANAVVRATAGHLTGVAIDCEIATLAEAGACQPYQLGQKHFAGQGSGGNAAEVRLAASEEVDRLAAFFDGVSLAVVVAGLGGGTGSPLLPFFLDLASERNVRTIVFAVTPFALEGTQRLRAAGSAEQALSGKGDLRILLPNDDLAAPDSSTTLEAALARATETLVAGMSLFWRLGAHPGFLALDAGALHALVVDGRGDVDMAFGRSQGPDRFAEALDQALQGRGLGLARKADSARAALVGVIGGRDLRLSEVGDAVRSISGLLPVGTPVRLSTVLEPEAEGTLSLVVLFFHSWTGPGAEESATSAPPAPGGRFAETEPSLVGGEDLDTPTYLRRNLRIDPS